jgi:hypothetical protein
MINWKWYSVPPIVILLGFFLGDAAWSVTYWLYSEPQLILCCAISTLLFIRGDMTSCLIAAGGASMIKQEGVLFLLLISIACLIFSKERKHTLIISLVSITPYLSWKLITSHHGINDSDFDFSADSYRSENLTQAYHSILECALSRWESYSGAITILPFIMIYCLLKRNWKILSIVAIVLVIIGCYIVAISFSSVEDIEWHLSATTRYMMLPSVIIFVSVSYLRSSGTDEGLNLRADCESSER